MTTAHNDSPFTFTHNGKTIKFEKSLETVQTPKWLRANRHRNELDFMFAMLEEVAGDEALEAIDDMTKKEFEALQKRINNEFATFS